ncbi:MAG: acyl-CoA dehydrogenase family protein [Proteobacteria bacterium]|nr:acyl-CoA dehydrogenase family protein [Pseudomonadota bacterium]
MFELNEPQRMVEQVFRQFAEKELLPRVERLESGEELPYDLMRRMTRDLMGGDRISKALHRQADRMETGSSEDGRPAGREKGRRGEMDDPMIFSLIAKELSRVSPGFTMSWGVSVGLCGAGILNKGTPDQIRRYAAPVMSMERIGAWALTEPEAGSDAFGSMKTTARPDGDDYVISGSKTFITNAPHADVFLVYAKLDRGRPPAERPVHGFIVERTMPGLSTGRPFVKMGMKDSPTGEVFLDEVRVPKENLLGGREDRSMRDEAKESLGTERSGMAPMCLGIVERCYELSLGYARQRRQFGRPIAEYQAIQLKLADMYIRLQNVWNIVYRLAWMTRNDKRDMAYFCATKVYCARAAVQTALDAIQIHGGYGYMQEYHVEKLMRDAKLLEIGAGTSDINALTTARLELGLAPS